MKILSIDTAFAACSVAVRHDGSTLAHEYEEMSRGQSEALMPMILRVLADAKTSVDSCDLIAVTRGPGAFTGLRIGLAAARGLSLASGVPCFGVTTTETIAAKLKDAEEAEYPCVIALDSKRSDLYVQVFGANGVALTEPAAIAVSDFNAHVEGLKLKGPIFVVGDAADRALTLLSGPYIRSDSPDLPDAAYVASVAESLYLSGKSTSLATPLYLRPADAALPKHGGRLRP